MYKAICRTNLDDFKQAEWPTRFAFPPRVGDYVEGKGSGVMSRPRLRIVAITHMMGGGGLNHAATVGEPYIEVELHRGG